MNTCDACGRPEGDGKGQCYKGRYQDSTDRSNCDFHTIARLTSKLEAVELENHWLKLRFYEYRTVADPTKLDPPEGSNWELWEYAPHYWFWRRPKVV